MCGLTLQDAITNLRNAIIKQWGSVPAEIADEIHTLEVFTIPAPSVEENEQPSEPSQSA